MPANPTQSQSDASRANGELSQGPTTETGKRSSRGNASKHGLSGNGKALSQPMESLVEASRARWFDHVQPTTVREEELVEEIALRAAQAREANRQLEQRIADNRIRDLNLWESNLLRRATEIAAKISDDPEGSMRQLLQFSEGCEWMLERWVALSHRAETSCDWDVTEITRALDLLCIPRFEHDSNTIAVKLKRHVALARADHPDPDEREAALDWLHDLIETEVSNLETGAAHFRDGFEQCEYDTLDHGLRFDTSPEVQRLRRFATTAANRRDRALALLDALRAPRPTPPPGSLIRSLSDNPLPHPPRSWELKDLVAQAHTLRPDTPPPSPAFEPDPSSPPSPDAPSPDARIQPSPALAISPSSLTPSEYQAYLRYYLALEHLHQALSETPSSPAPTAPDPSLSS